MSKKRKQKIKLDQKVQAYYAQNYNNEIVTSPKHQQLIQQKLQSGEAKSLQQSQKSSEEKIKQEIESGQKYERSSNQKWKDDYNQKLGEYLDDHKEMQEFCIQNFNDSFAIIKEEKQQQMEQLVKSQEKQRDFQDQLIRSKLQMTNQQNEQQQEQKRGYGRGNGNIDYDEDLEQKQFSNANNFYQNQQSPQSYNEYVDDDNMQLSQNSSQSHQQNSCRGSTGGQNKKILCQTNYNNLSIIFSESEKSSPQLKQSTQSSQQQQSSSILGENNKEIIEYDISDKHDSAGPTANAIPNTQIFDNIQYHHLQNNRNTQNITTPVQPNTIQQSEMDSLIGSQINKNQHLNQTNKNGDKNKIFNLDGIAEELFRHSDYLQQQINQAQSVAQRSRSTSVGVAGDNKLDRQKSIMSNDSCNTSINIDFTKKSDANESLIYLKEAFQLCMQEIKSSLASDTYNSIEQNLKSVQQAYHSHIQLEIERSLVLEKKNENLNRSNDMIVQALQATKEEIKQLIQNYHLLSEDHNDLIQQNTEFVQKEKKYLSCIEKIEKERQHLKYLILVANEKYEKIDEKCNHLLKKNSILNEQISNMQNQFSNINQILREVIINLQENKDSETHHILQQILKGKNFFLTINSLRIIHLPQNHNQNLEVRDENLTFISSRIYNLQIQFLAITLFSITNKTLETNDLINKKENESQFSRYSHFSPNASCSARQQSVKENSLGRIQKTRVNCVINSQPHLFFNYQQSSSPIREGISPPSKSSTLNHATSSYLNSSLKSKENKFMSSQQGVGTAFQNISINQTSNKNKKAASNCVSSNKASQNSIQQAQPKLLNQSSGSIKQKENINRQKTPPKSMQKQILPARSKEDQKKIEETYRQIFLKQLKQSKIKDNINN